VPGPMEDDSLAQLERIGAVRWKDSDDRERRLLEPDELEALSTRKGSLTDKERDEIELHATMSYEFLGKIPFPPELARIPEIAWSHHERMDGSGYPRALKGDAILPQARIVMVADVFDALTSEDRPYKAPMSPERALRVVQHEASTGAYEVKVVDALRRLVERGRLVPLGQGRDADPERPFDAKRDAWR